MIRRFEKKGETGGIVVVDDYAHHPTEVAATLAAARQTHPDRRIVVLFQPHLYSRTSDFAAAFGAAFLNADVLLVAPVYGSREAPREGVTGALVADAATARGHRDARFIADREDILRVLEEELKEETSSSRWGRATCFTSVRSFLEKAEREKEARTPRMASVSGDADFSGARERREVPFSSLSKRSRRVSSFYRPPASRPSAPAAPPGRRAARPGRGSPPLRGSRRSRGLLVLRTTRASP